MIRCLVTDRRRLCPDASSSFEDERRRLVERTRRAVAERIDLVQIRERDLEARDLARLVSEIVTLARGSSTRVVVNDRLDIALACEADGVHLRADSISVDDARRVARAPFLVGRSVHSVAEAVAAAGADYLIAGTVFPSPSKPPGRRSAPLLGLEGLRAIVAATDIPVLAIGGITADRFDEVAATGAAGVAAIGLFIDSVRTAS